MNRIFTKRLLAMLLAVTMIFGMLPVAGFAAEEQQETEIVAEEIQQTEAPAETEAEAAVVEETEAEETVAEETVTEETVAEETVTEETVAEETVTEETVAEEIIEEAVLDPEVTAEEMAMYAAAADYDTSVSGEYFNVISAKSYDLAPGAVEKEIILNNDAGNDRKIFHIFEVDTYEEDLEIMPGYYGIDKLDPDNLPLEGILDKAQYWQAKELTKTVAYYEGMGYNVVGAMNTALAYDSNAPYGYMVWNGVVLGTPEVHKGAQTYLAIDWEGNCELRSMSTPLTGNEKTAISANFGWLVKDGKLTSTTVERTSSDASRSMIGIKEDGTLIFCQVDGRADPVSTGLSNYEMGEAMLALGCVNAVNCDGGGSSTFVSKRGDEGNEMRSIPSDGSERPTINSVILVSTAGATGILDKVVFESDYEYIAPGASMAFSVTGKDTKTFDMEVPEEVTYEVAEEGMGSVEDGVFTAGSNTGVATVQAFYNGEVVGELVLNVVHPETFGFAEEETVLPYGKDMELEVFTSYGADNWEVCVDGAYELILSDDTAATLAGNTLIATGDESKAGVDVTVIYTPDTTKTGVLKVSFGKGSEILFDFEDGDVSNFLGVDEMYDWAEKTGAPAPIQGDGNYSENTDSEVFLASAENGQVRSGDYALGVTLDYTDATFASWSYNMFFHVGDSIVLRDVANGMNATTLGMWVYIPEGAAGLAMQIQGFNKPDGTGGTGAHFYFTTTKGAKKNLNSCTEEDIPESRWVYATVDLTAFGDFFATYNPYGTNGREPSFIRYYVKPNTAAKLTFYFDDFTLDYSSAVEDRVLPTITDVSYATQDTAVALENGATVNGNTMSFSAVVADNQKLDTASGRILVDGNAVSAAVSGKYLSSGDVSLTSGVHTVTFEIEDALGNLARVNRTFTVSGDAAFALTGHNESGDLAEYGSVYYADINVADIASLDSLTATVKLQTANTWEPEGMTVAPGFSATYELDELANALTVTVTRDGAAVAAAEGETTLVSLPIRLWTWDGSNHVTDVPITPEAQFNTGYCPVVSIDCDITYGKAVYANGASETFGGTYTAATKINDIVYPWHYHDAELTVLNKAATCTEEGYENRTYCETCKSVIDWGTTLDKTPHVYGIVDNQLVCVCGDTITGNGIVSANGKLYCLIADKLVTGWQAVEGGWCYVAASTKEVQTGEFTVNKLTYTADENGIVVKGAWVTDSTGTKYSFGPAFYNREWVEIDGAIYYFGTDDYIYTGIRSIPVNRNNMKEGVKWYEFTEDGVFVREMTDYTGILSENGMMYYVKDGMNYYGGLLLIDGDYYYARTSGEIVCGKTYWITKTNDLLPAASYTFGEDGKMIDPPVIVEPDPEQPEVKNGVYADETGKLWYYENDVKTYGGLLLIDGDYYYARTSGEIVVNRSYYITKNNDLLPVDSYTFGADGKMLNPPVVEPEQPDQPEQPEVKNGVFADETGKLWYYVNDVKTYGGLMKIDGDYYYARTSGEIVVNRSYYISKTNDLLPVASYTFGADGKMIDPPVVEPEQPDQPEQPEVKNGVCADETGKLWYYVNDVKTYGGLLKIDGDYYYARTSGEIVVNRSYYITKNNDLLPIASYTFGADGKMVR